jgi:hypothetical protein
MAPTNFTAGARARFAEIFERDVDVLPVSTGSAANALSLAALTPPCGSVLCHRDSHIITDECGAPEFSAAWRRPGCEARGTRTTDSSSPIEAPASFIRSASGTRSGDGACRSRGSRRPPFSRTSGQLLFAPHPRWAGVDPMRRTGLLAVTGSVL